VRVAVTGAAGQLGGELTRAFTEAGALVVPLMRPGFTLEAASLPSALDLVVNAAAWTDVDGCARDPDRAMRLNGDAPGHLARIAHAAGARFVQISTNEVFDGAEERAYAEGDATNPINPYGASKLAGERAVRAAHSSATIVRTAWIFGGPRSFPTRILAAARKMSAEGRALRVVADEVGNPTPAAALADRIVALATRAEEGPPLVHLAGEPPVSRYGWAARLMSDAGLPLPEPIALREYPRDSTPPAHAVLNTALARSLGIDPIEWSSRPAAVG
jgi:dTDP-4-dehydrorhamnose reductase